MTVRYIGIGGSDGNDGLSWAQRKLTFTSTEDVPVAAGDDVYVGPGVYREQLFIDVSGTDGNEITFIADVTGENTDGIGGVVRWTGSNDDLVALRGNCFVGDGFNYRTFRGFTFDLCVTESIEHVDATNWIIEDCVFGNTDSEHIVVNGTTTGSIIRRCIFYGGDASGAIVVTSSTTQDNQGHIIENCIFIGRHADFPGVHIIRVGGGTVRNCAFLGLDRGVRVAAALTAAQKWDVNNCIFEGADVALEATATGEIVEDFNSFYNNTTNRTTVDVGSNSLSDRPSLLHFPLLFAGASQTSGFKPPWFFGELSEWSSLNAIAGTGEATEDLLGLTRPTTSAKKSWGAVQFVDSERETGTVRNGVASIVLHDAGRHQIFVPVTKGSTTFSVFVHRESSYAGINPRMIIKQPGQTDVVVTDAGAASQFNELTTSFTTARIPPYVVVELVSLNTATAGSFEVFFDDLKVT